MANKMTYVDALTSAIDFLSRNDFDSEVVEKLEACKASYQKRNASKGERKPSKNPGSGATTPMFPAMGSTMMPQVFHGTAQTFNVSELINTYSKLMENSTAVNAQPVFRTGSVA